MKRKKEIAIFILIVSVLTIFSSFFVYAESHHDCAGEDCPVCAILQIVGNVAKFALILCATALTLFVLSRFAVLVARRTQRPVFRTLIDLKTKLTA